MNQPASKASLPASKILPSGPGTFLLTLGGCAWEELEAVNPCKSWGSVRKSNHYCDVVM